MMRLVLMVLLLISSFVDAATLKGSVMGKDGKPIANAVISLMPVNKDHLPAVDVIPEANMDQWQKQYVPYDLPVRLGTNVHFPNRDDIKHHVYSFSPAKRFELKLYSGVSTKPVLFDKPGVVVLGCNIHDWMLGYIYVLETPYYSKTDEKGQLQIMGLPDDDYIVSVWHPRLRGDTKKHDQALSVKGEMLVSADFTIKLKRERRKRKLPGFEEEAY